MGNADLTVSPAPRPRQRWPLVLAVVFTVAFLGALGLVAVDLVVGRPLAGDLFVIRPRPPWVLSKVRHGTRAGRWGSGAKTAGRR
jgi:hypothetical protein